MRYILLKLNQLFSFKHKFSQLHSYNFFAILIIRVVKSNHKVLKKLYFLLFSLQTINILIKLNKNLLIFANNTIKIINNIPIINTLYLNIIKKWRKTILNYLNNLNPQILAFALKNLNFFTTNTTKKPFLL